MLQNITKATIMALGLTPLAFAADSKEENRFDIAEYWRGTAGIQYDNSTENKRTKEGFGYSLDTLVPVYGNVERFWFVNAQLYNYGDLYRTYSFGVGHRERVDNSVYGMYAFYDRQRSAQKNYYDRVNVGIERMDQDWSLRYNLYWYGAPKINNLAYLGTSGRVQGNNISIDETYMAEQVYSGMSAEVGYHFNDSLSAYAGYYTYGQVINGSKWRVEYSVLDNLNLTAATQYDHARGWLTTMGINYSFGSRNTRANSILDRLRSPVVRDMTVAAYTHEVTETTQDTRSVYFVRGDANLGATGTQGDAMNLQDALSQSKEGDFIYLDHGQGTDIDMGGLVTLKANQTVTSSATGLSVDHKGQAVNVLAGNADARPTLTNGGFLINHAATLSGFDMDGSSHAAKTGIEIVSATGDVLLENLNISNYNFDASHEAVFVHGVSNATVTINGLVADNNADGVVIGAADGSSLVNVVMNDSTFSNNSVNGVRVRGSNATLALNASQSNNNTQDGLSAESGANVTINRSTFADNGDTGIYADDANIVVNNSEIYDNGFDAIGADNGGQITINSPVRLEGYVASYNDGANQTAGNIAINVGDISYTVGDGDYMACMVNNEGIVTCS